MLRMNLYKHMAIIVISVTLAQTASEMKYTEVMKKLSYSFGLNLLECGDTGNATQPMEKDIYNYWNLNYNLSHISTGCLVLCAMAKLELIDDGGQLKEDNAEGYIRANGGDGELFSTLLSLYMECRRAPMASSHPCGVALEVAKCFRRGVHDRRWTPDISSLLSLNE